MGMIGGFAIGSMGSQAGISVGTTSFVIWVPVYLVHAIVTRQGVFSGRPWWEWNRHGRVAHKKGRIQ
jgi:hypothetical protein